MKTTVSIASIMLLALVAVACDEPASGNEDTDTWPEPFDGGVPEACVTSDTLPACPFQCRGNTWCTNNSGTVHDEYACDFGVCCETGT